MLILIKIANVSFLTMYDIMIKTLLLLLPFYHIIYNGSNNYFSVKHRSMVKAHICMEAISERCSLKYVFLLNQAKFLKTC